MKTTISRILPITIVFLLGRGLVSPLFAQGWSVSDSLLFESVRNDTSQLRRLAIIRHGDRIAAKAQNRLGAIVLAANRLDDARHEFMATYQQYLSFPERNEATYSIAMIARKKNQPAEAKPFFKEFLQSHPTGEQLQWARYYLLRAMSETKDSNFVDSAQTYFVRPHDLVQSKDVVVQREVVRFYADRQDFANAISAAQSLVSNYNDQVYIHEVEGKIVDYYLALGNSQAAMGQCNALLRKYQPNTDDAANAQQMLAAVYASNGNFARARAEYAKVAANHPSATNRVQAAQYSLALLDMTEGQARNDSTLLATALRKLTAFVGSHPLNPHVPSALTDIAELCSNAGRYEDALSAYGRVISFDTTRISSGNGIGQSNRMKGHRALVLQARMAKAVIFRTQMQNPTLALAEYESILGDYPGKTDVLLNKALCFVDLKRKDEARVILEQLVTERADVKEAAAQILSLL